MPEVKLDCTLVMESDWHVGSGGGRHGAVDRLLERDGESLPYVPASTLRGVWRDAAERLALGLDGGSTGKWQALVRRIFGGQPAQDGQPQRGCLVLEDGRLPVALRARMRQGQDARLREALTFVKPGVAIDAASGRARDDFLRFEEMGRAGTVLQGQGWLRLPDGVGAEDTETVKAFLLAAALLVERIGGKRRRGAGRCRLHVRADGMTVARAPELIEKAAPPAWDHDSQAAEGMVNEGYRDAAEAGDWLEIQVLASVETPIIIPQQVMGNVVTTQDHVPGTYLLRHVAGALKAAGMADPWAHVAAGDVQVLPLFPCDGKEARALPMPICLEAPKNDDGDEIRARNTLRAASEEKSETQYKGLKGGYIWPGDKGSLQWLRSVPQVLRTHNTVEDERQRPTEAVGGVFTFEAIAPRIRLGGAVRISKAVLSGLDAEALKALRNGLAATLHVGRASRMGYGRIRLEAGKEGETAANSASSGDLVLLLTSDLILPGEALGGATHLDALIDAVEQALDTKDLFDREQARAHLAIRRVEGWQQRWGLPRPTLVAIAAGSVIRLPLAEGKTLDDAMLQRLAAGLGERRGEGFGQVMVNPPFLQPPALTVSKADDDKITISEGTAEAPEVDAEIAETLQHFEELVEETAWRTAIIEAAEAVAASSEKRRKILKWGEKKPGSSQLGVLRTLLLSVPDDGAKAARTLHDRLKSWVEHVKSKDGAADRWGNEEVLDALLTLTDPQRSKIWEVLQGGLKGEEWPGALRRQEAKLKEHLHLFAVRTFLLRAMHHHRRMLESAGKQADDGNRNRRQEQQEEVAS